MLMDDKVNHTESRWIHALQVEWLGQMIASLLWAFSVFVYGITSTGDMLQLCAALAWMIANIATLHSHIRDREEQHHAQKGSIT